MAVAVDAHRRHRTERIEALSDSSDHLFADARILSVQRLGYKTAVQHHLPRAFAETLERQRRPVRETRRRADGVYARQRASQQGERVRVVELRRTAREIRECREPQPAMHEQALAVAYQRRGDGQFRRRELGWWGAITFLRAR